MFFYFDFNALYADIPFLRNKNNNDNIINRVAVFINIACTLNTL